MCPADASTKATNRHSRLVHAISWPHASSGDLKLLAACKAALGRHQDLLAFIFDPHKPELRLPTKQMLRRVRALSSGEQILVQFCMDLWGDYGGVKIGDIVHRLDPDSFEDCLKALKFLRGAC